MRPSEWIAIAYFAYLFLVALVRRLPARRRLRITLVGVAVAVVLYRLSELDPATAAGTARNWAPAVVLLAGYWMSGLFYTGPMPRVEQALRAFDERVLGRWYWPFVERAPRALLEALEGAYLLCYPLVPIGLVILLAAGHAEAVDRYWTYVLLAEFISYGFLPWLQTRPPRAIEPAGPMDYRPLLLRRVNLFVLGRGSIQVNTLPSGHAAGAVAVTLVVGRYVPEAILPLAVIAAGIVLGSVIGRYHYAIDAIAGIAVAAAIWLVA